MLFGQLSYLLHPNDVNIKALRIYANLQLHLALLDVLFYLHFPCNDLGSCWQPPANFFGFLCKLAFLFNTLQYL